MRVRNFPYPFLCGQPLKDQHGAEKDLQLFSTFLTGLICMLAIHKVKNNKIIFKTVFFTFCNHLKTNMLQKKIANLIFLINRVAIHNVNDKHLNCNVLMC